ncbi:MAG: hypothetical protein NZ742_10475 [Acidobacteria bacterium]|nr:hypothetical protein [Acidobacteriota bacterium]MDW7983888.1 hypothetical protein [Acidobacteriota bacterium]
MIRRAFTTQIRLGLVVLACLGLLVVASQARAGSTIMVIPASFSTNEAYDENGDKVSLPGDVVVPNVGLLYSYSFPLKIAGMEDWNPSLSVTMLYWFAKVDASGEPAVDWESIFAWPIVSFGSKYLDLSVGYQLDLGTLTDGADALSLGGTVKYPFGSFEVGAGFEYYWTFREDPVEDPSNLLIVKGTGAYSFGITEDVRGNIGLMVAYYSFSEVDGVTPNYFLIRPTVGISHGRFSFNVAWGSVDEYTTGGISISGKAGLVKKATGFRAFIGYSF